MKFKHEATLQETGRGELKSKEECERRGTLLSDRRDHVETLSDRTGLHFEKGIVTYIDLNLQYKYITN